MADEKFSQFPAVASPAGGEIVGLSAGDNARFPASAFATGAQGAKADTAVQSVTGSATVAVTGSPTAPIIAVAANSIGSAQLDAATDAAIVRANDAVLSVSGSPTITVSGTADAPTIAVTGGSIGSAELNAAVDASLARADIAVLSVTGSSTISVTGTPDDPILAIAGGSVGAAELNATVDASLALADSAVQSFSNLGAGEGITGTKDVNENLTFKSLVAGTNVTLTPTADTITIASTGGGGSSPLTTKGDLYTHDLTVDARLPAGTVGQMLAVNPATATGLEWIPAPTGSGSVTNVSGTPPISVTDPTTTPIVAISAATGAAAGSMSASDKTKLDAITGNNTGDQSTSVTAPITNSGTAAAPNIGISAATGVAAGSMSSTDKTKLDAITGINTGDVTVSNTATVGLTLTGQALTADIVANSVGAAQLAPAVDASLARADLAVLSVTGSATISVTGTVDDPVISVAANSIGAAQLDPVVDASLAKADTAVQSVTGSTTITVTGTADDPILAVAANSIGAAQLDPTVDASLVRADSAVLSVTGSSTITVTGTPDDPILAVAANSLGVAQFSPAVDASLALADTSVQSFSNLGAGTGIIGTKDANENLTFKSLIQGANITLTSDANTVTIAASGGGGGSLTVQGDGVSLTTAASLINFVGATTTEPVADQITVAMPMSHDRFWYKSSRTTPIVLVVTGQSNPDGVEVATVQFPVNPNVKIYSYGVDAQPPSDPTNVNYSFVTPNPAVTYNSTTRLPMVGYYGANHGNIGCSMGNELNLMYDRPVIILSICLSGGEIEYWLEKDTPTGLKNMNEWLGDFWNHIKTLPELTGVTFPDILIWGQSESNAGHKPAFDLTPQQYDGKWQTVYSDLITRGVINAEWTNVYLMSMTDAMNATYEWEGLNLVARNTNDKVTMTSGVGLASEPGSSDVHFTGNAINLYGKYIAQIDGGLAQATDVLSTNIIKDKYPTLGADLDSSFKNILNTWSVELQQPSSPNTTWKEYMLGATNNQTWSILNGNEPIIPSMIKFGGTHTAGVAPSFVVMGKIFDCVATFKNANGVITNLAPVNILNVNNTFQGDGASISMGALGQLDVSLVSAYTGINGGNITCATHTAMQVAISANAGSTITTARALLLQDSSGPAGLITHNIGVHHVPHTKGTNNASILASAGIPVSPWGTWFIYQDAVQNSKFNGGFVMRTNTSLTGTANYTATVNDYKIIARSGSTGTLTLPTLAALTTSNGGVSAAAMKGFTLLVKNADSTALTVTAGAGITFERAGMNTVAADIEKSYTFDGVSAWM
jgi:hypothetical protein